MILTIQTRRDTAANWTSENPTLAAGELAFETDTGKIKIGTGSTAWTSLSYFSSGAVSSVFGRTGAVTATSGDYAAAQVGALAAKSGSTNVPGAGFSPKVVPALTDGSSVPIDASLGNLFDWSLGGASHTLAAPSNSVLDGQTITVRIKYGGSFTPLFNAIYDFGSGSVTWSATSGKTDHAAFTYCAAANSGAGTWRSLNAGGLGYAS